MSKKEFHFSFDVHSSDKELNAADNALLNEARKVTKNAYAPYSNFHVGAVAKLSNGETVVGTNQENASYPVGICAERVLLSSIASRYPGQSVDTIAISYDNKNGKSNEPVSPCGICRQSLLEYEERTKHPIRLILSGLTGEVIVLEKASQLLPLAFGGNDLRS
ncbi:cytidine deaminase [Ferruginibacter albus]|nr:cytidine deaminase [Ferruginibacter albus]UAY51180.1 cytidine deaminase [Ferruginibacter albus]